MPPSRPEKAIAIVGLGLRVPGARHLDELWQLLASEGCAVTPVPPERWDRNAYYAGQRRQPGKTRSVWGGFLDDADCFDAAFFKISPREAELMDPQQRLALELSWKAVEDAGIRPGSLAGSSTGVFMGLCNADYARLLESHTEEADAYFSTGIGASLASNRISYLLDLRGPSATIDAACASSLVAVHQAVQALQRGECAMALAGGVNLCWTPRLFVAYSQAGMLSPTGACRSFDDSADGYVRAEGGGVLLLKPLLQAQQDGDPVYAVIRGSGVNHGGRTNSLTVTNPKAQGELIARVVRESGVAPQRISYVETHGPGTPLGDPIEVVGLKTAFSSLEVPPSHRCGLGSVKSNLGHLESAAGVAGIAKVLAAMAHRTLPGTAGFQKLSRMVRLEGSPFYVVERTQSWDSEGPRVAGVSGFGFGGVNAHLLLEEVEPAMFVPSPPGPQLFPISARTPERLRSVASELLEFLLVSPDIDLAGVAYTLQTGRDVMEARTVLQGSSIEGLVEALRGWLQDESTPAPLDPRARTWLSGGDADWAAAWSSPPRRLRLPTYPFERQRHWLTPKDQPEGEANAVCQTLVPSWQPCSTPEPLSSAGKTPAGRTLLVGAQLAHGELLAIGADSSVQDIARLLQGDAIGTVVWQAAEAGWTEVRRLLRTLKALYGLGYAGRHLCWQVVTLGALEELADPASAAFHGVLRAMAAEHPRWRLRLVDVAPGIPMPWNEILAPAAEGEPVWSYREQGWHRQQLSLVDDKPPSHLHATDSDKVYLVIGGAGGVGSAWSRQVAENPRAKLVWLGRRPPEQALRQQEWTPHLYLQADAGDPEQLRRALTEAARLGPLAGVVLSNKTMLTERLERLSEEALLDGLRGEERVCASLATVLAGTRLDFVLIFSSVSSLTVEPRQSLYSAACMYREAFARRLAAASESPVKVISWGYWGSVGSVAGSPGFASWMERAGIASIEPADAMPVLDRLLAGPWHHLALIKTLRPEGRRGLAVDDEHYLKAQPPGGLPPMSELSIPMLLDAPAPAPTAEIEAYAERWLAAELNALSEVDPAYQRWLESYRPHLPGGTPEQERQGWRSRRASWLANPALAGWVPLLEAGLENLADILRGRVKAVDVLFPGGSSHLVEPVYSGTPETDHFHSVMVEVVKALAQAAGRPLRVLELGAGTGSTTRHLLEALPREAFEEYLFTDVSSALLRQAEGRFGGAPLKYRLLNLERHPVEQDLELGSYDLVLATNCVHATRDLRVSLRHAKALLRQGGALLLNEIVRSGLLNHLTFGLLPGWWRHQDQRDDGPIAGEGIWTSLMESEGLELAGVFGAEALCQRVFLAGSDGAVRYPRVHSDASAVVEPMVVETEQAPSRPTADRLEAVLIEELCSCLKLSPQNLKPDEPFANYGLDSIAGIDLVDRLGRRLGLDLETTIIFDHPTVASLRTAISAMVLAPASEPAAQREIGSDDQAVAVIGMSGQFPGAPDLDSLSRRLLAGVSAVEPLPAELFSPQRYQAELARGSRPCRWGGRLSQRDAFDPLFFSISPRDASGMSPHQTLVLQEGWRCLEDAGYNPRSLAGQPVGVFIGVEPSRCAGSFTGTSDAIVSSRLSYHLDLRGPALSINTGCSSSAVSLHTACESLRRGEVRMALAGGVFADLNEEDLVRLSDIGMLSPSGSLRAFQEGSDGTVLSEAVVMFALKRLSDAVADGDAIHGVIRASGINQDGSSNGITAPNGAAQEELLRQVYAKFSIDPAEISYIESHGTGTPLGDPIEAHALKRVFGQTTGRGAPCMVGSVKTHLGHTAAAAGATGLAAVLLAMKSGRLPGLLGEAQPNRHLRLEGSNLRLLRQPEEWARPRTAAVSSFGHSGTNAHLVVAEVDHLSRAAALPRAAVLRHPSAPVVVPLSARGSAQLGDVVARLKDYLEQTESCFDIVALAHTLQTGRFHHPEARLALLVSSWEDLRRQLEDVMSGLSRGVVPAAGDVEGSLDRGDSAGLAGAWAAGAEVLWERLYEVRPGRVHLPTTPFAVEFHRRPALAVTAALAAGCHALVPQWQPLTPSDLQPVASTDAPLPDGPTLLLGDSAIPWANLWGSDLVLLAPSSRPEELEEALAARPRWGRIALQAPDDDALRVGFRLFKALLNGGHGGRSLELVVLAQAGEPQHSALLGLAGSAAKEHPSWRVRLVELESQQVIIPLDRLGRAPLGASRLDARGRWKRRRLVPVSFDDTTAATPPYRQGGVYLMAGGAGGLAGAFSRHLAKSFGAKLVWLGRSPADDPQVIESLREFPGATPLYFQADLTDRPGLVRAYHRIKKIHPHIHGIVHSALVLDDASLARMEESRFFAAVACKAEGSENLLDVMREENLDFVLLFSALNSFAQPAGQSNYVAGCCYQDALAERWESRWPGRIKVVNWGYWGSLGVVASDRYRQAMLARGIASIEPADAMPFLDRLLASPLPQAAFLKTLDNFDWPELEIATTPCLEVRPNSVLLGRSPVLPSDAGVELADSAMLEMERVAAGILARTLACLGNAPGLPAAWLEGCRAWTTSSGKSSLDWGDWDRLKAGWPQASARLLERALRALPEVASGHLKSTEVLFPDGSTELLAEVYREDSVGDYARRRLAQLVSACAEAGPLRILELGGGTGATTEDVLAAIPPSRLRGYLFSDLSAAFLGPAKARFGNRLEYRCLDVEKPFPKDLGSFDVVLAANVLHATADLEKTVIHAKSALRRGGMLVLQEVAASSLFFHLTFGLLDGWWKTTDPELRCGGGPLVTPDGWRRLLDELGFSSITFPASAAHPHGQLVVAAQSDGVVSRGATTLAQPKTGAPTAVKTEPQPIQDSPAWAGVGQVLLAELSRTLMLEVDRIDPEVSFMDYGLDSISGVALVASLNRQLGSELSNVDLFDYPTVVTMARHIEERYGETLKAHAAKAAASALREGSNAERDERPAVAIIGMSGRFTDSDDYHEFWSHLRQGHDKVGPVGRFPGLSAQAALLDDISRFDARFFNISGSEAAAMDPQQRIFLEESWSALEDAGYAGSALDGSSCAVYLGCHEGDYSSLLGDQPPAQAFWGNSSAIAAARIAYVLNLKGPAIALDTACSSSLVAVHMACQSLCSGEVDMAVAGGVFLHSTDKYFRSAERAGMLSSRGRCATFDGQADGFVFGEGAGALVLKRLDQAIADGDAVHAVIRAWGVNQDGTTNGITAPSARSQEELIGATYQRFAIDPSKIGCLEAHGTATKLGDPIELQAMTRAFRRFTDERGYCALGSLKSSFGHASAAAGVAGVLKLAMSMKAGELAPSLHFQHNAEIDFDSSPFRVNTAQRLWPRERPLAAISGFGFSGTNAHLVLDHPPQSLAREISDRSHLVLLSARSPEGLDLLVLRFISHGRRPDGDCGALAYTLLVGRKHHKHRLACLVTSGDELADKLGAWRRGEVVADLWSSANLEGVAAVFNEVAAVSGGLAQLAQDYVRGQLPSPESMTHAADRRRVHLPTYPFARTRFWARQAHRMLSQRPGPELFANTFTGQEVFLADHQLDGHKVMPGVAYLEMAREAAAQASSLGPEAPLRLRKVVWIQPLVVDGEVEVKLRLQPQARGWRFELLSQRGAHAQGLVESAAELAAEQVDLVELKALHSLGRLDGAQCYESFHKMGFAHGAAHQGIGQVLLGQDSAMAELIIPAVAAGESFVLHPSMLDSALQVSAALTSSEAAAWTAAPLLPFELEELQLHRPCQDRMWVRVTRADAGRLDYDLWDGQGRLCVRLRGFLSRRLDRAQRPLAADVGAPPRFSAVIPSPQEQAPLLLAPIRQRQEVNGAPSLWVSQHRVLLIGLEPLALQRRMPQAKVGLLLPPRTSSSPVEARFEEAALALLEELRDILAAKPTQPVLLQVVISTDEPEHEVLAGLAGMLKTARLECSVLVAQLISVPSADGLAERLFDNGRCPTDTVIGYGQQGERTVEVWEEVSASLDPAAAPWRDGGCYLVTGSNGRLGAIFAREIAAQTKGATLVLSGRAAQPQAEEVDWLTQQGARVIYWQADLGQAGQVEELFAELARRGIALSGILHAAGVLRDSYIPGKTDDELREVLGPKVRGLVALDRASQDHPLEWLILFSAGAGAFGNAGQADYAAANAFMDCFAAYRNRLLAAGQRRGRTVAVDWPLWREGGMTVALETEEWLRRRSGMVAMSTPAGVQALYRAIASTLSQLFVVAGEPEKLRQHYLARSVAVSPAEPAKAPIDSGALVASLLRAAGAVLHLAASELDPEEEWSSFGFDSISLTMLANRLNDEHGLELTPTIFFERSTPCLLAATLAGLGVGQPSHSVIPDTTLNSDVAPAARRSEPLPKEPMLAAPQRDEAVAIVGLSVRFPGAADLDEFWRLLSEGRSAVGEVPLSRWDWQALAKEDPNHSRWGGFIDGVEEFDPLFFGLSGHEAEAMDPSHRLLLMHAWKAIEHAGYDPRSLKGSRTGVFVGLGSTGYDDRWASSGKPIQGHSAVAIMATMAPNRISYFLDLRGPSEPVETACSSTLVAVHRALGALRDDACSMVLVGGANLLLSPRLHISTERSGMLASDGRCKAFAAEADGYVRSEGVGMLLLKPLSQALADGDTVHAVIRGSAENHGGRANSFTSPNPAAQTELLTRAYARARVDMATVGLLEAHGTGTKLGDPIEVQALKTAFAGAPGPCALGSVKSNLGHLEVAAGLAGLVKAVLCLRERTLVPTLHCQNASPLLELQGSPFQLTRQLCPFPAPQNRQGVTVPRRAGVSSFGAGGSNAHVVLEEAPLSALRGGQAGGEVMVVLSARTAEQLQTQISELARWIDEGKLESVEMRDLAYTLQVGRHAMEHRAAAIASSPAHLLVQLRRLEAGEVGSGLHRGRAQRDNPFLEAFRSDAGLTSAVETWLRQGRSQQLLELWVQGLPVPWEVAYGSLRPQRVPLPTYPFARDRFMLAPVPARPSGHRLHPLVHRNISSRSGLRFESLFFGDEAYLADHLVSGRKILPGAAYLEMARAAASLAWDSPVPPSWTLRDVFFLRPLTVDDEPRRVRIELTPIENGLAFAVASEQQGERQEHCRGVVHPGRSEASPRLVSPPRGELVRKHDEAYRQMEAKGLLYGPSHRGVQSMWGESGRDGHAVASARIEFRGEPAELASYELHPGQLDSILQTTVALDLSDGESSALALPFAAREVEIFGATTARMTVVLRAGEDGADLEAVDEQGRLVLRLMGFQARTRPSSEAPPAVSLVEAWARPSEMPPAAAAPGRLLLIADDDTPGLDDWTGALAGRLSWSELAAEATLNWPLDGVMLVWPNPDFSEVEGLPLALDLLRRLLEQGDRAQPLSIWGVTSRALRVGLETPGTGQGAGLHGLLASLAEECPAWKVTLVDREPSDSLNGLLSLPPGPYGRPWAVRQGLPQSRELLRAELPEATWSPYRPGGVYVVIGGSGGLGGVCSRHIARQTGGQLVWLGRRPLDQDLTEALSQHALAAPNAPEPVYLSVDARDPLSLGEALGTVRERFGGPHGVVVSTLTLRDRPLQQMSVQELLEAYSAKASVAESLRVWMAQASPDFLLFFSSLMAYTPQRGQANYAAGCCAESALAQALEASRPGRVKLIHWGYWGSVGAVAGAEKRQAMALRGVGSVEAEEAMRAVDRLLTSPLRQLALTRDRRWEQEAGGDSLRVELPSEPPPSQPSPVQPPSLAVDQVVSAAARALGVAAQELDPEQPLTELGFDAVSFQRFGRELAKLGGRPEDWGPSSLSRHTSLSALAAHRQGSSAALAESGIARAAAPALDPLEVELEQALKQLLLARLRLCQEPTSGYLVRWWQEVMRRLGPEWIKASEPALAVEKAWPDQRLRWAAVPHHLARLQLVEATLAALPDILSGARAATEVMFPGASLRAVQAVYREHPVSDYFHAALADQALDFLLERRRQAPGATLRVLEVGAGTGATSAVLLAALDAHPGLLGEYLYSDLSAAFLSHAEEVHAPGRPYLRTRRLNLEEALPLEPVYDLVIAANVLHATSDIAQTLRNLKTALRPGGGLLLNEICDHSLYGLLTFGLLEGWWRFQDPTLRMPGGPGLSPRGWHTALEWEGYRDIAFPAQAAHPLGQQIVKASSDGVVRLRASSKSGSSLPRPSVRTAAAVKTNVQLSPDLKLSASLPKSVTPPLARAMGEGDIRAQGLAWLTERVAHALKLAPADLDPREPLASYGLDSILVVGLSSTLSQHLPVSTSELFEHGTLASLAGYLLDHPSGALLALLQEVYPATDPASLPTPATALDWSRPAELAHQKGASAPSDEPIAIVGIAARFAGSDNLDEMWQNLSAGRSCISEVPRERWDWRATFDSERGVPGRSYSRWAGFLHDIDAFDPLFFRIAPSEAEKMDPNARLFLETAYACLEDAAITPSDLAIQGLVGVFVGLMNADYPGASPSVVANRVSYHLDLRGPSLAVDTACSSSLSALHMAVESLRRGDCASAIAGGVNLMVDPVHLHRLCEMSMLSEGQCNRAFAAEADGFVAGEGVAAVLLKPLSRALADGDQVHGLILGSAVNAGGRTSGFTVPAAGAQAEVIASAWRRAGIDPRTISYMEAHGTGTVLGDPLEVEGLRRAFAEFTSERGFCALGSVKSNVGHCEGAAGMAGLCKVLLQMRHERLVPTLHAENLNPRIDFESSPFFVQRHSADWMPPVLPGAGPVPRRAGLSSFGAGGANAHLVLQEHADQRPRPTEPKTALPLLLSARDEQALRRRAAGLRDALGQTSSGLLDVVTTLALGREAMAWRLVCFVSSKEEAVEALDSYLRDEPGAYNQGQARRQAGKPEAFSSVRQGADAWVSGADVSWRELLPIGGRRISLPTYPFAKERYWLAKPSQPVAVCAPILFHFDGSESFFQDHRPAGRPTLPAATTLELVRAAAEEALQGPVVLENLVWPSPVYGDEGPVQLRLTVTARGAKQVDLELCARHNEQWQPCLLGSAQQISEPLPPSQHEVALLRPWEDRLDQQRCYAELSQAGLEYGSAHRCLAWVSPRPDAVIAELQSPLELVGTLATQSGLLDSAMQAGHWLGESPQGLPFALRRLEIHGPLQERMLVVVRPGGESGLDVDMCDGEGVVLLRLQGLSARPSGEPRSDLLELCRGVASGRLSPGEAERLLGESL